MSAHRHLSEPNPDAAGRRTPTAALFASESTKPPTLSPDLASRIGDGQPSAGHCQACCRYCCIVVRPRQTYEGMASARKTVRAFDKRLQVEGGADRDDAKPDAGGTKRRWQVDCDHGAGTRRGLAHGWVAQSMPSLQSSRSFCGIDLPHRRVCATLFVYPAVKVGRSAVSKGVWRMI